VYFDLPFVKTISLPFPYRWCILIQVNNYLIFFLIYVNISCIRILSINSGLSLLTITSCENSIKHTNKNIFVSKSSLGLPPPLFPSCAFCVSQMAFVLHHQSISFLWKKVLHVNCVPIANASSTPSPLALGHKDPYNLQPACAYCKESDLAAPKLKNAPTQVTCFQSPEPQSSIKLSRLLPNIATAITSRSWRTQQILDWTKIEETWSMWT